MSQKVARVLAVSWMGLIFVLSAQPDIDLDQWIHQQDKIAHAVLFGVLGALYLASMKRPVSGYGWAQVWLAVALTAAYGAFDEWHQSMVPERTPELADLIADVLGGLAAAVAVRHFTRSPTALEGSP